MKKIAWVYFVLFSLLLGSSAYGMTLYDTYRLQKGYFPPWSVRIADAESCGIFNYRGTYDQNVKLQKCLANRDDGLLGVAPPDLLTKTIRTDITAGTQITTFNVDPLVTAQGRRLRMTDIGERMFFRIGSGSNITWGYCDALADNTTYYTLSSCQLGLQDYGTSTIPIAANINAHSSGETFLITNQHHWMLYYLFDVRATSTVMVSGTVQFATGTIQLGNDRGQQDVYIYAQNGAITTARPFVTYRQSAAKWLLSNDGTNTIDPSAGGSGLTAGTGINIQSSIINFNRAVTSTGALGYYGNTVIIATSTLGGIHILNDGLAINTSTALTFTGTVTTTNFAVTGSLNLNNLLYQTPTVQGVSSSVMVNDGTGKTIWDYQDWRVLDGGQTFSTCSTTPVATTTMQFIIPTSTILKIVINETTVGANGQRIIQFNDDGGANYGYRAGDLGGVGSSASAGRSIYLNGGSTTTPMYFNINIFNDSGNTKRLEWTYAANSGTGVGMNGNGNATWDNSTNAITKIKLSADVSAKTLGAGSKICIFGSRD